MDLNPIKPTFSFGKNWKAFLNHIDNEKIQEATLSLTKFLSLQNLNGKTFLDIGCGSGLFSLAAFKLGASKIISIDIDPFSVECCKSLHQKAGNPKNWIIYHASILNKDFVQTLEKFDVVYSWGVLHHTGNMWQAIQNSANLVKKAGYFYIAIYNKKVGIASSDFWLKIKKLYNSSSQLGKYFLKFSYTLFFFLTELLFLKNPFKTISGYKSRRGMSWKTDMIDWIGGYPYEFASVDEVFGFIKKFSPGFKLMNIKTTSSYGNNEFLYYNE